jgi:SecD/SecF fusion protein
VAKGYEKAFSTIIDSNLTTFFVAFILYKVGTGPVKGFGLTLMVGIASSLFSALTVTRSVFDWKLSRSDANSLNIGKGIAWFNTARVDMLGKVKIFIGISVFLAVVGIGSIAIKGFEYGIDFTGGVVYTLSFEDNEAHSPRIQDAMSSIGYGDAKVRRLGGATAGNQYMVSIPTDKSDEGTIKAISEKLDSILPSIGSPVRIGEDIVGPSSGKELRFDAILAVLLSWIGIGLYVWARFGKLGLGFGVGALLVLVHDTLIVVGIISVLGLSIDGTMIAALLTMIGYSINDTIVIYDRIRENIRLLGKDSFATKVNLSINQSFSRTIITSVSTLFVCVVLVVMGSSSIKDFGIVMCVGIVVGTYSSICIGAPFLTWWAKYRKTGI